jgi:hypothetical protein
MLSGADRDCFSLLQTDLQNQYGYGNDLCPKSTDQCFSMLIRWTVAPACPKRGEQVPAPNPSPPKQEDNEALVFAQEGTKGETSKPKSDETSSKTSSKNSLGPSTTNQRILAVRCKNCGRNCHASAVCPELKMPPAQIHVMDADNASQASDESSVIILAQLLDKPIERYHQPINEDFVLLDSQSTVDLFSNPKHVKNIRPADTPIRVHCNKGTMLTTEQTDFGDTDVYFDANGIAKFFHSFDLPKSIALPMTARTKVEF